jgi:hypothetical protein
MARDIAGLLEQGAHQPWDELDEAALRRRGRRFRRRRQVAVGLVAGLLLLAMPAFAVGAQYLSPRRDGGGVSAVATPSPKASPVPVQPGPRYTGGPQQTAPNALLPWPEFGDGGQVTLPVTFLDGTTAELVYPRSLALHVLGVRPYGWGELGDCCQRDFHIWHGEDPGRVLRAKFIRRVAEIDGRQVTLWSNLEEPSGPSRYLIFQFGFWWVAVWDGAGGTTMTDAQLEEWARSMLGSVNPAGFLTLRATGSLRLAGVDAPASPPNLSFGMVDGRTLELSPTTRCDPNRPEIREGPTEASQGMTLGYGCRESMALTVTGDRRFVEAVLQDLQVRNVRLAPHRDGWAQPSG